VTKVGVVGAGLMASQLAMLFAQRLEVPVVMTDLDQAASTRASPTATARSTSCSSAAA
jgi:3-hydroxyacyl-CoA dehydrogenase